MRLLNSVPDVNSILFSSINYASFKFSVSLKNQAFYLYVAVEINLPVQENILLTNEGCLELALLTETI